MLVEEDSSILWLVILGFIIAFVLAFGIGANDVANSFGTSVGSKVLTLFQACVIASIFELAGAILIGSKVSETVRKGIIDINGFTGNEELAMAGAFSALTATSIWLLIATFLNLPVSGTHSIVGATIGYGLVAFGGDGITWSKFGLIAASWVISPVMSGIISSAIFVAIDRLILRSDRPLNRGLLALPLLFGATIFINFFSIFYSSPGVFGMDSIPWYGILGMCIGIGVLIALIIGIFINPWLKKIILNSTAISETVSASYTTKSYNSADGIKKSDTQGSAVNEAVESSDDVTLPSNDKVDEQQNSDEISVVFTMGDESTATTSDSVELVHEEQKVRSVSTRSIRSRTDTVRSRSRSVLEEIMKPADGEVRAQIHDDPYSARLFKYLQILTASFGAFAHGGNDVSNAIGPVITLWLIYKHGEVVAKASTPYWILIYGGVGIIVGLCVWGRRVIATIGENLSPITPTSGFAIEIGAALTVLLASNLGIPVSTTHCKVGSVVIVGRVRSKEVVDWSLFGNIVLSWVVTMPITGGISAAIYAVLREVLY